jgi:hypothetical protein
MRVKKSSEATAGFLTSQVIAKRQATGTALHTLTSATGV